MAMIISLYDSQDGLIERFEVIAVLGASAVPTHCSIICCILIVRDARLKGGSQSFRLGSEDLVMFQRWSLLTMTWQ